MGNNTLTPMSGTSTPKMWKDLTSEEKIERMRQEIKGFSRMTANIRHRTNQLRIDFLAHDHKDGRVVMSVDLHENLRSGSEMASSLRPDPKAEAEGNVYF